jgi:hypothetical protein
MPTRRDAVLLMSTLPAGLLVWPTGAVLAARSIPAIDVSVVPDRQLTLNLSDDLQRQQWVYAGQRYEERREHIVVYENETVRFAVVNDTSDRRSLMLESARIDLHAGESVVLDLNFDSLTPRTLRDMNSTLAREIVVRPSYQTHAAVST